jgi:hypothetical protein
MIALLKTRVCNAQPILYRANHLLADYKVYSRISTSRFPAGTSKSSNSTHSLM